MKVGLYPRVSTQEQAREGYSVGEQIERLKNYCAAKGWSVYKIYTDAGFSGANMNRPGLGQLIADVQSKAIDMVLVYKLDRLSRSQKDTLYLIEDVFIKNNVHFASITENFDTSTPFGRAMIGILSVFAQLEREQFRERSIMGKEARAREGLHHGGKAPTGYDYVDGSLIINEFEAVQIREIYRLFTMNRLSISAISKLMTSYSSSWQYEARVKSVLRNPLYAGWIHSKNELYKGKHEPLVSQEIFDLAQNIFSARSKPYAQTAFTSSALLGGILWCRCCGARYFKSTKITKRNNKKYVYEKYECYSRAGSRKYMVRDRSCKNKIWDMKQLDSIILYELEGLEINPDAFSAHVSSTPDNSLIFRQRIEDIEKQISRFSDLYARGCIDIDSVSAKIASLRREQLSLKNKIEAETASNEKASVLTLRDIIHSTDSAAKKQLISALIKRIELDGEDIFIYWNFV